LARIKRLRYGGDLNRARGAAIRRINLLTENFRTHSMVPTTDTGKLIHSELVAEARYVQDSGAHVNQCPLLIAYSGISEPGIIDLRRAAATILGNLLRWKRQVADLQGLIFATEREIMSSDTQGDIRQAVIALKAKLLEADLPEVAEAFATEHLAYAA
jgi:hypothetical protein